MSRTGTVTKGWGHEEIWASTDEYCGKMMHFKSGTKSSMHFHAVKDESWYIVSGNFKVVYINTKDASTHEKQLDPGDTWHNPPLMPHQLICINAGIIVEVSTKDTEEDNYRVSPGDSQL